VWFQARRKKAGKLDTESGKWRRAKVKRKSWRETDPERAEARKREVSRT